VLPPLDGLPIRVSLRRTLGPYHASSSIRRRVVLLDSDLLARRGEFERILLHEIFHFAWVRLSNARRREWEDLLRTEIGSHVRGELGWSSEWRKNTLLPESPRHRDPRWRRYACESFCDTAAWLFAGIRIHDEFTLGVRAQRRRRGWFNQHFPESAPLSI
jgi:hypothetical protein